MTNEESTEGEATSLVQSTTPSIHPQALSLRVQIGLLVLVSTISIGSHYVNHSLSSLGPQIMQALSVQRTQFGLLFSSEEIPGIILPILGGVILTYLPYGPSAIFLSSAVLLSASLCAIAVSNNSYLSLLLGRFLFGVTNGALTTLQGSMIAHWFPRKIGAGFGVMLLVSRLSTFAGLAFPAFLYDRVGLSAAMWFSVLVCVPSIIATVLYNIFDTRHKRRLVNVQPTEQAQLSPNDQVTAHGPVPTLNRLTRSSLVAMLRSFTWPFWLVCFLWIVTAGVVFSSLHFLPDVLSHRFKLSTEYSGLLTGSLAFVAGVSSPIFGVMQDQVGRRASILAICCGLLLMGTISCAIAVGSDSGFLFFSPVALIYTGLGAFGAGFAAGPVTLMSCVALTVPDSVVPAALGIYKASENTGLAVIHLLIGAIRDVSGKYLWSFAMLAILALFGLFAALLLGFLEPSVAIPGRNRPVVVTAANQDGNE